MKLDIKAFAYAVGLMSAILYTICAILVAVAPEATMTVFSYLFHLDLTNLARTIGWGSYFVGLIGITLGSALIGAGTAWFYNTFCR